MNDDENGGAQNIDAQSVISEALDTAAEALARYSTAPDRATNAVMAVYVLICAAPGITCADRRALDIALRECRRTNNAYSAVSTLAMQAFYLLQRSGLYFKAVRKGTKALNHQYVLARALSRMTDALRSADRDGRAAFEAVLALYFLISANHNITNADRQILNERTAKAEQAGYASVRIIDLSTMVIYLLQKSGLYFRVIPRAVQQSSAWGGVMPKSSAPAPVEDGEGLADLPAEAPDAAYKTWCDAVRSRVAEDYDAWIAIIGERGGGKSTTALELAREFDPCFDIRKQVVYTPEDFLRVVANGNLHRGQVLVLDEMGEIANALDYATRIVRAISKMAIGNRWQGLIFILCMPAFTDAASRLREIAHYCIEMRERDFAVVYRLKNNLYSPAPEPYRYTLFELTRCGLPSAVYEEYRTHKETEGRARLQAYLATAEKESGGADYGKVKAELIESMRADPAPWWNAQGYVSLAKIRALYRKRGLHKADAEALKQDLDALFRPEFERRRSAKKRAEAEARARGAAERAEAKKAARSTKPRRGKAKAAPDRQAEAAVT